MRSLFAIIGFCLAALLPLAPAHADVVQTVKFGIAPKILVWGEASSTPVAPQPVMTGLLQAEPGADGEARFRIASNTPFRILAQRADGSVLRQHELEAAGFQLQLASTGPNARGSGQPVFEETARGLVVYAALHRTAVSAGNPESQSLEFLAAWESSAVEASLVFTVIAG